MSALDLSTGTALSFAVRAPEAAARSTAPAEVHAPPNFSDLIAKMAPDKAKTAPAVPVAERWLAWREQLLRQGSAGPVAEDERRLPEGALGSAARAPQEQEPSVEGQPGKEPGEEASAPAGTEGAEIATAQLLLPPVGAAPLFGKGSSASPAEAYPAPQLSAGAEHAAEATPAAAASTAPAIASPIVEGEAADRAHWSRVTVVGQETHMGHLRPPRLAQAIPDLSAHEQSTDPAGEAVPLQAARTATVPRQQPPPAGGSGSMAREVVPLPPASGDRPGEAGAAEPRPAGVASSPAPADPTSPRLPTGQSASGGKGEGEHRSQPGEEKPAKRPASVVAEPAAEAATDAPRAPAATQAPLQQIAGRVVAAALAVQREGARIDTPSLQVAAAPIVKVLSLQLQPQDLGTISIRMSLREDALDIRLEASNSDTAGLLQRDQEALVKLITSAGYRIEAMAVSAATGGDGAQLDDGRSSGFSQSAMSGQSGSSEGDARSSGGRDGAQSDPRRSRGASDGGGDKGSARRNAGGDLYL
jgi:hypothetical protein